MRNKDSSSTPSRHSHWLLRLVRHLELAFGMTIGTLCMWILGIVDFETFAACAWFSHTTLAAQFFLKTNSKD
jgi:xanthine/uracil permease